MRQRNFWRATMFALLLLLIPGTVFAQDAPEAQGAAPPDSVSLIVMTWNIEGGGHCERNRNMSKVGRVISRYDPDVIVLQEVHRKQVLDLVFALAHMRTYVSWFVETKSCGDDGEDDDDFGLAVLSSYPIGSRKAFRLRNHPKETDRDEFRTLLRVAVRVDSRLVRIYNTHLTSQDDRQGDKYREWQVIDILGIVAEDEARARRTGRVFQPVLMGDFNFKDTTRPSYPFLMSRFKDAWSIWARHHTDFDNPNGFTSPTRRPDKRIDYVFAGRGKGIRSLEVIVPDVATILHDFETQNLEAVPDHLPVIANLVFN